VFLSFFLWTVVGVVFKPKEKKKQKKRVVGGCVWWNPPGGCEGPLLFGFSWWRWLVWGAPPNPLCGFCVSRLPTKHTTPPPFALHSLWAPTHPVFCWCLRLLVVGGGDCGFRRGSPFFVFLSAAGSHGAPTLFHKTVMWFGWWGEQRQWGVVRRGVKKNQPISMRVILNAFCPWPFLFGLYDERACVFWVALC